MCIVVSFPKLTFVTRFDIVVELIVHAGPKVLISKGSKSFSDTKVTFLIMISFQG